MEKKIEICFYIFMFILGCAIGAYFAFYFHYKKHKDDNNQIVAPDTTYNKVVFDSIEYNIIKKDSIIYNLKQEMKNEVTESFKFSDSVAVELFKELCTTD